MSPPSPPDVLAAEAELVALLAATGRNRAGTGNPLTLDSLNDKYGLSQGRLFEPNPHQQALRRLVDAGMVSIWGEPDERLVRLTRRGRIKFCDSPKPETKR